jgi:hypothetical protein
MIINLIPDSSVAQAPSGFTAAVQAAANNFDQTFIDNITINVRYGWGTLNGVVDTNSLIGSAGAEGESFGDDVAYSTVKSWLTAGARSSDDSTALGSLRGPVSTSVFVGSAQEKALDISWETRVSMARSDLAPCPRRVPGKWRQCTK